MADIPGPSTAPSLVLFSYFVLEKLSETSFFYLEATDWTSYQGTPPSMFCC